MWSRKLVAAAAALACAAGVVVAVAGRPPDRDAAAVTFADPSPSPEISVSLLPTTEPAPSALPTISTPAVPPLPSATVKPPRTSGSPKPKPAPPPGPTSFHAERGGVSLDVRIDRSTTPTAQLVTFRVVADGGAMWLNQADLVYGDGMGGQLTNPVLSACAGNDVRHTTDQTMRHAYRLPGTYEFAADVYAKRSTDCAKNDDYVRVELRGRIVVTAGESRTNGPWPLSIDFANEGPQRSRHPYGVLFQGAATDEDGFIREMSIDWGDGTPPSVTRSDMRYCEQRTGPAWPSTYGWATEEAEHVYARPGDYVVTFRAVSVGCDGRFREDAALRTTVTARA